MKIAVALMLAGVVGLTAYAPDYRPFSHPLAKDQEILHALDRLTFGPRPGDVEAVRKMGLKKWIDQQLHPERIAENPEMIARLEPLESLHMTRRRSSPNYPPPQVIQAMMNGRLPLAEDPEARAEWNCRRSVLRASAGGQGRR